MGGNDSLVIGYPPRGRNGRVQESCSVLRMRSGRRQGACLATTSLVLCWSLRSSHQSLGGAQEVKNAKRKKRNKRMGGLNTTGEVGGVWVGGWGGQ